MVVKWLTPFRAIKILFGELIQISSTVGSSINGAILPNCRLLSLTCEVEVIAREFLPFSSDVMLCELLTRGVREGELGAVDARGGICGAVGEGG